MRPHRVALLELLEALARAANEATTPEAAMRTCLERISTYGGWSLGRVALLKAESPAPVIQASIWHGRDMKRFAEFVRVSENYDYKQSSGRFISVVLREKRAVWIPEFAAEFDKIGPRGRLRTAVAAGLHSGFAFPIIAQGEVAAFIEFFSGERRRVDPQLLGAIGSVGAQLARLIERDRAQMEHARLAEIVERSQDAIVSTAPDRTILTWNDGAERMFGYQAAEVLGRDVSILMPEERLNELGHRRAMALAGQHAPPHQTERLAKGGRRVPVSISASPLTDGAGKVTGVALIYRDISELKLAQTALETKARLSQLMESLARAANEAASAETAMLSCLELIAQYGNWMLGRVATFATGQRLGAPQSSVWHCPEPARFAEFIKMSNGYRYTGRSSGQFVSEALRDQKPVWVPDLSVMHGFGRLDEAAKCGLRAGFVFPVVAAGEFLAFLEFFANEVREPDTPFLEVIGSIAAQLARLIERARAQAAHAQLAAIVENSDDAIASRDLDRRFVTWNAAAERLFGYSAQEAIGQSVSLIIPPDQVATTGQIRERLASGESIPATDTVRLTKDGRRIDVSITQSPIKDADGRVTGVSLMFRDITERKQAEIARARLAAIVEHTNAAIISRTPDGVITSWNPAAERLFGYTAGEAIGQHVSIIIPPELHEEAARTRAEIIAGHAAPTHDAVRVAKDGRRVDVSIMRSPIRNERGEVVEVSVVFHDITERRQAEEKIRQLAHFDSLTGLPNRALFYDRLGQAIGLARRERYEVALMYIDLDRFKAVNDTLGHGAGDELLKAVSDRIRARLRDSDTVARIGGDEFIAILPKIAYPPDAEKVARKLLDALSIPFPLAGAGQDVSIGASIGIAVFPGDAEDMDALIKAADAAMYEAKQTRNDFRFYDAASGARPGVE